MDTNIRICGAAGQGLQSMGVMLAKTFAKMGVSVFATQTYLSRVRGGVNTFDLRLTEKNIQAPRDPADILVALNEESLDACIDIAGEDAVVVFNSEEEKESERIISVDLGQAAKDADGTRKMINTVAAGMIFALLDCDTSPLEELIAETFESKGEDVVEKNTACVRKGAEICEERRGSAGKCPAGDSSGSGELTDGSIAIGLAAAVSGIKLVNAYPMTPSTGVFTYLASNMNKFGIVVEQAEDEVAALNLVCGAVYAGVPAMTCTSGGGFALMSEALSLAGVVELPVLVFLSQRPGPATGLPTRTEQSDLKFAVHGGHGEFPRAIFAPGTIGQSYELTRKGLETAHKYQTPAFLMSDHFLTHAFTNDPGFPDEYDPIDRMIEADPGDDYLRYKITDSGISPRSIPGGSDIPAVADSHEHSEDGHISEDPEERVQMVDKRLRKYNGMIEEALAPEVYPEQAGEVLLCWGSTYGPCREAVDILREGGADVCMAHFPQVWPLNVEKCREILEGRKVTAVEGNAMAQFAGLLSEAGALGEYGTILRYDGFPFTAEYITGRYGK